MLPEVIIFRITFVNLMSAPEHCPENPPDALLGGCEACLMAPPPPPVQHWLVPTGLP